MDMKRTRIAAVAVLLVTLAAMAQNPQSRGVGQARQAAAASQQPERSAPAAGQPQQRPQAQAQRPSSNEPAASPQAPGSSAPGAAPVKPGERRDPFVSTIKIGRPGDPATQMVCGPGIRSIVVGQAEINGIARSAAESIAVVTTTNTNRTFFLRQGNQVCNGRVMSISEDSVVFEENAVDALGKPFKREVIKKIPAEAK